MADDIKSKRITEYDEATTFGDNDYIFVDNADLGTRKIKGTTIKQSLATEAQIAAIEAKGAETLESIPGTYSELSDNVDVLKSALDTLNGISYTPALSYSSGTIIASDGSIVSPSGYKYTQLITVYEGETVSYSGVSGGNAMFVVGMYDNAAGNADTTKSVNGTSYDAYSGTVIIPEGVRYIRLCTAAGNTVSVTITRQSLQDIESDIDDLKETEKRVDELVGNDSTPVLTMTNGLIQASNGKIVSPSSYKYSQFIPVSQSESVTYSVYGSSSALVVAMYADKNSDADITKSVRGIGENPQTGTVVIPSGIKYIRVCTGTGNTPSVTISAYSIPDIKYDIDSIKEEYGEKINHVLYWTKGLIQFPSGDIVSQSNYNCSQEVAVKPGECFELIASGSSGAMVLAMYNSSGTIISKACSSGNNGTSITIKGVVPSDAAKIRVCTSDTTYGSFKTWFPFERTITQTTWEGFPYIYARRPVIGFMLDGEYDLNEAMHDVFAEHGKKCAFCITYDTNFTYNAITKYMKWQNEGFEIGAHGNKDVGSNTSYTDEQVKGFIKDSYTTLTGYGFDVKAYVSLSGSTAERFIPEIKKWFSYGCTQVNHSGNEEPCHLFGTAKPYYLWRYGMQVSTIDQMKAAVDRAISENALLLFYGHAQSSNDDNFTTTNLDALLTYIEGKDVEVMRPYDAVASYFALRYDDFYPQT